MKFMTSKTNNNSNNKAFNYDLERMQQALKAETHKLPDNLDFKDFQQWMKQNEKKA